MEIIGACASGKASQDWSLFWSESPEAEGVQEEIDCFHQEKASASDHDTSTQHAEYAMSSFPSCGT